MKRENNDKIASFGVVSYLNAQPLIEGLDSDSRIHLHYAVPADLPDMLRRGAVDAALIPCIDWGRHGDIWQRISNAGICCDGPTMTVRVYSKIPPKRMTVLYTDSHSHNSVVLARLIWKHCYGRELEMITTKMDESSNNCESVLVIGDKVVTTPMHDYAYDIDLGQAWKEWTGLPFVFAVWAAPAGRDHDRLAALLNQARDRGVARAVEIARQRAADHGWPVELAEEYLTQRICYTITPAVRQGMQRFLQLASEEGIIACPEELVP